MRPWLVELAHSLHSTSTSFAEFCNLASISMDMSVSPESTWSSLLALKHNLTSHLEYVEQFTQLALDANILDETQVILFRQGLSKEIQRLLLAVPLSKSLVDEICMVTELLQRLNSLSQALEVPCSVVPSPLSTNFDLSTPHLFFVTLSVALCSPSGKKYARRVKALIDTGSERNYVSQYLADKWILDGTTYHHV